MTFGMQPHTWRVVDRRRADVVVVGSGAAGMNAALSAAAGGASVVLLDKGAVGRSGASVQANVSASAAPEGRWEQHAEDIVRAGGGLARPELAAAMARDALARFEEWAEWGVRFKRDETGAFRRHAVPGHSEPRAVSPGYGMGEKVCRVLRKRLIAAPNVEAFPYTPVVDLFVDEGEVRGVLAWDFHAGGFVAVDAPCVVLATGGAQELFPATTSTPHLTGDGHAVAVSAGAGLVHMEFVLFVPVCLVRPRPIGISRTAVEAVRKVAGALYDRYGRRFADEYAGPNGDQANYEVLSRAIAQAMADGRGTAEGTVYYSASDADLRRITEVFPSVVSKLESHDIDLRSRLEVRPMAHFFPGGIAIDEHAATAVPGLFAAGEAAGGIHGATRLGGDAFAAAAVFGARAGVSAARRSRQVRGGRVDPSLVTARMERVLERRGNGAGESPAAARSALQQEVAAAAGPLRSAEALSAARNQIARSPDDVSVHNADPGVNYEFLHAVELEHLRVVAAHVLDAALARRDSIGAHFRVDALPGEAASA